MNEFLHHAGTGAAVMGAVSAWVFVVTYRGRSWRAYEEGRHLMAFTLVLAVILTYVSVRAVAGTSIQTVITEAIRLAIYASLSALLVWRVRLLRRPPMNDAGDTNPDHPDDAA